MVPLFDFAITDLWRQAAIEGARSPLFCSILRGAVFLLRHSGAQHHTNIHALLTRIEPIIALVDPIALRDDIELFEVERAVRPLQPTVCWRCSSPMPHAARG